ncbi:AAA family ATPase [Virgisporangium ochraceum]
MTALIVFAGLPGSGKSTVAEVYGDRIGAPVLAVDTVDRSMQSMGVTESRPGVTAYVVVARRAEEHLRRERTVVVDAVNAVEVARQQWRELALRSGATLRFVEVVCSDPALHRARVEARHASDPWKPDWARVAARAYEPWTDERTVLDSASHDASELADRIAFRP